MISIKVSAKIGVYDNYNVFIDLINAEDYQNVWFRKVIKIDEMQMWLQKWYPDFKLEEDLPVALAWALLPICTPLALDAATLGRTMPRLAKIRVEMDLLKLLPESLWIGKEHEDSPLTRYTQKN
ncbi:hypothetical protein H5410_050012 [Solanum commersonii]|uniref:DUF4283 domain-containing protein n=1 Tax=Solanum commersonii TaxID=4109 RepID=A0A9J5WU97_SOLCO|nr:hypothetical protein H5410_050012 [Solanum commersonii]